MENVETDAPVVPEVVVDAPVVPEVVEIPDMVDVPPLEVGAGESVGTAEQLV